MGDGQKKVTTNMHNCWERLKPVAKHEICSNLSHLGVHREALMRSKSIPSPLTKCSGGSRVWKGGGGGGGFMRMCTVATTPPFDAHAHRCNESGCCCFNGL